MEPINAELVESTTDNTSTIRTLANGAVTMALVYVVARLGLDIDLDGPVFIAVVAAATTFVYSASLRLVELFPPLGRVLFVLRTAPKYEEGDDRTTATIRTVTNATVVAAIAWAAERFAPGVDLDLNDPTVIAVVAGITGVVYPLSLEAARRFPVLGHLLFLINEPPTYTKPLG